MANTPKSRFEDIKTATFGIIFLGTPHRGSPQANMGQIIVNLAKIAFKKPQKQLLETLKQDSYELDTLSEEFSNLHSALKIVSCYEQKETEIAIVSRGILFTRLMVGIRT